jgi:hypothetical protein
LRSQAAARLLLQPLFKLIKLVAGGTVLGNCCCVLPLPLISLCMGLLQQRKLQMLMLLPQPVALCAVSAACCQTAA